MADSYSYKSATLYGYTMSLTATSTAIKATFTTDSWGEEADNKQFKIFVSTTKSVATGKYWSDTAQGSGTFSPVSTSSVVSTSSALTSGTQYYVQGMLKYSDSVILVFPVSGDASPIKTTEGTKYTITYNGNGGTPARTTDTGTSGTVVTLPNATQASEYEQASLYTITFNPNGGTVSPTTKGTTCQLETYYTLKGWYSGTTSSATKYGDAESSYTITASKTMYAQWTSGYKYGPSTLASLPTPTYSGRTFLGWYTAATGGEQVTTLTEFTSNKTIYAHWSTPTYTITYNGNGGTPSRASDTKTSGTTIYLPSATMASEYDTAYRYAISFNANGGSVSPSSAYTQCLQTTSFSLKGWYSGTTSSATKYGDAGSSYTITADKTMYAQWNSTTTYGDSKLASLPTPTWFGHTFQGWYTSAVGGTSVTTSTVFTESKTIYAHWTTNNYKVTATAVPAVAVSDFTGTGTYAYGTAVTVKYTNSDPTKYVFKNWWDGSEYVSTPNYTIPSLSSNYDLVANFETNYSHEIAYYINKGSDTTTTYDIQTWADTSEYSSTTLITGTPSWTGHTFKGWASSSSAATVEYQPGGTITNVGTAKILYAVWETEYKITYYANYTGASPATYEQTFTSTAKSYTFTTPTVTESGISRPGYTFNNWHTQPDESQGGDTSYSEHENIELSVTNSTLDLYAWWDKIKTTYYAKLKYFMNGGTPEIPDSEVKSKQSEISSANIDFVVSTTVPTISDGRYFWHWEYVDPKTLETKTCDSGDTITIASYAIDENDPQVVILNAIYYTVYSVECKADSAGTTRFWGASYGPTSDLQHEFTLTLDTPESPIPSQYFLEWADNPEEEYATLYKLPGDTLTLEATRSNMILYPIWGAKKEQYFVRVDYDTDGGSSISSELFWAFSSTEKGNVQVTIKDKAPTKEGYTFIYWSCPEIQQSIFPGDTFVIESTATDRQNPKVLALTAHYTINKYNISFNNTGGTYDPSTPDPTGEYNYGSVITLPIITKEEIDSESHRYAIGLYDGDEQKDVKLNYLTDYYKFPFKSWKDSKAYDHAIGEEYTVEGVESFTAVWKARETEPYKTVNMGIDLPTDTDPLWIKSGYKLIGFSSTQGGAVEWLAGTHVEMQKPQNIYAVWEKTTKVYYAKLNFNTRGGSPTIDSLTGNIETTEASGSVAFTIPSTELTKEGYTFKGWSESTSATSGSYQPGASYSISATSTNESNPTEKTLYAAWQSNTKTYYAKLEYDANGGTGDIPAETKNATSTGSSAKITFTVTSSKPTKDGNTFVGWNKDSAAEHANYYEGDNLEITAKSKDESNPTTVKLYAVWTTDSADPVIELDECTATSLKVHCVLSSVNYDRTIIFALNGTEHSVTLSAGSTVSESVTFDSLNAGETYTVKCTAKSGETTLGEKERSLFTNFAFDWTNSETAVVVGKPISDILADDWNRILEVLSSKATRHNDTFTGTTKSKENPIFGQDYNKIVAKLNTWVSYNITSVEAKTTLITPKQYLDLRDAVNYNDN